MTPTDHSAPELDNEEVAHEHSDVDVRAILGFGAGLAAVVAASFLLMWVLFRVFAQQAAASDPPLSPLAMPVCQHADIEKCPQPPEPRLQTDEPDALAKVRMTEAKSLEGYGWINQIAGVAHIPIAEAKKLILLRGLPVRAVPAVDPRLGTHAPAMGESSGGRTIGVPPPAVGTPPAPAPPAAPEPHGGHK